MRKCYCRLDEPWTASETHLQTLKILEYPGSKFSTAVLMPFNIDSESAYWVEAGDSTLCGRTSEG